MGFRVVGRHAGGLWGLRGHDVQSDKGVFLGIVASVLLGFGIILKLELNILGLCIKTLGS